MRDFFLVSTELDHAAASETAARLGARGLQLGETVWLARQPGQRVLPAVDRGLTAARFALVLVTPSLIERVPAQKELDGLAARRRVICVLYGADEAVVAMRSPRLATSALPHDLIDRLGRLVQKPE